MATHKSDLLYWIDETACEQDSEIAVEAARGAVVMPGKSFIRMLRLERRRTERSGRAFILVLIKSEDLSREVDGKLLSQVADVVARVTRETDLLGWYASGSTLGLLMTEIGEANAATHAIIMQKILLAVEQDLTAEEFRTLLFQFRLFPQDLAPPSSGKDGGDSDVYYPDISHTSRKSSGGYSHVLKRSLDIVGSLLALLVFLPVFLVIAALVKLTSRGPVLFCQKRLGHFGREFNFYKFRTMYSGNDPRIHQ